MDKLPQLNINLAKNRGQHVSERILTFALTIGRVLVIVTEAVALGAFLFRFGLDRQLVDLHDRITQEQEVVNLLKHNEATYRNLQERLAIEAALNTDTTTATTIYTDLSSMVPQNMAIQDLYFSPTIVEIQGTIPSLLSLSSLVKQLQSYHAVDSVSLDKIENKTAEGDIDVSLTVNLKKNSIKSIL